MCSINTTKNVRIGIKKNTNEINLFVIINVLMKIKKNSFFVYKKTNINGRFRNNCPLGRNATLNAHKI